jgi:hypothetical protein
MLSGRIFCMLKEEMQLWVWAMRGRVEGLLLNV